MTKEDLKYVAKVIRRYCKQQKFVVDIVPDYTTGYIAITGLPNGLKAIDVCGCVVEKGVPVYERGDTKVLIKF